MAEYYRTRFAIEGAVGISELRGVALLEDAASVVREWAGEQFGEPLGDKMGDYAAANGAAAHIDGELLEESGFWGLTLEHPDRGTDGVRWRSDFRFGTEGGRVEAEVDVRVRKIGSEPDSFDASVNARYPNALVGLFRKFVCKSADEVLTVKARRIAASDAATFVNDAIFSPKRVMPLVVVSERRGRVLVNPDYLQWRLLGLAVVSTYDDAAARAVREHMGDSPLGCWDGYIRAYRPGCLPDDDMPRTPWRNRYWTWRGMYNILRQKPEDLLRDIGDECLGLALPQPRPRLYEEVSSRIRRLRYERVLERAEGASANAAEYKDLWELADSATRENDALRKNNDELLNRIDSLESQLAQKISENEQLSVSLRYSETASSDYELDNADELRPEFGSVSDVVEYAKETMDRLRFFSDALEKAMDSNFQRPNDVHDALKALDECAEERTQGPLGMDIEEWMGTKGIDYAPHEGEVTKGKFGSDRTFTDDIRNARVLMPAHIKLGLEHRIHVIWGEDAGSDEGKWLIGYIGKHRRTKDSPN